MELSYCQLFGCAGLGLFVGTLTGLFGAGGGFIITPALNILLGIPMNVAVGTSSLQVVCASLAALWQRLDQSFLGIKIALFVGLGIPFGSYGGASVVELTKRLPDLNIAGRPVPATDFILLCVFAVFLSFVAGWLLFDNFYLQKGKADDEGQHKGYLAALRLPPRMSFRTLPSGEFSLPVLIALGLLVGFLSGLLGIGGGVVMMPILFYLVGQPTKAAVQTDLMIVFTAGCFASVNHIHKHNVNYKLAAFLIVGALLGSVLGTRLNRQLGGKSIRRYFAFVVLLAVVMVSAKLLWLLRA